MCVFCDDGFVLFEYVGGGAYLLWCEEWELFLYLGIGEVGPEESVLFLVSVPHVGGDEVCNLGVYDGGCESDLCCHDGVEGVCLRDLDVAHGYVCLHGWFCKEVGKSHAFSCRTVCNSVLSPRPGRNVRCKVSDSCDMLQGDFSTI